MLATLDNIYSSTSWIRMQVVLFCSLDCKFSRLYSERTATFYKNIFSLCHCQLCGWYSFCWQRMDVLNGIAWDSEEDKVYGELLAINLIAFDCAFQCLWQVLRCASTSSGVTLDWFISFTKEELKVFALHCRSCPEILFRSKDSLLYL